MHHQMVFLYVLLNESDHIHKIAVQNPNLQFSKPFFKIQSPAQVFSLFLLMIFLVSLPSSVQSLYSDDFAIWTSSSKLLSQQLRLSDLASIKGTPQFDGRQFDGQICRQANSSANQFDGKINIIYLH